MMVSTRVAGPTDTLKQVATLGRLTLGGSLLGPLAHEVNNFVQGLFAVVYLFQDCVEQGDPIEADFIEDLSQVVTELASIGHGIQEFARQEVSGPEPVELPKVIDQAAAFLRSAGKLKTVELSVDVSTNLPRLFWPKAELDFVVSALLSNAADAASKNTEVQAVQLVSAGSDDFFTIEIKDSGSSFGLVESSLPFCTTGPEHRNLGLGLSIVGAIVASHGGSISAEKHELGNVVRVTLPLATDPKVALEQ
jgi:C4-dicarboxylate-specific signal transduction histidine kinase